MMQSPAKIVVTFERRADGGLMAYSEDVPGFVLSHTNTQDVLADVKPALEGILSHMFGGSVVVEELSRLHDQFSGLQAERQSIAPQREYVMLAA
jgi:hypothetical protein